MRWLIHGGLLNSSCMQACPIFTAFCHQPLVTFPAAVYWKPLFGTKFVSLMTMA